MPRQWRWAPSPLVGEGWGEGLRSIDRAEPLTRIASVDAIRPLPQGERCTEHVEAGVEANGSREFVISMSSPPSAQLPRVAAKARHLAALPSLGLPGQGTGPSAGQAH
jgi:hypothetical protein